MPSKNSATTSPMGVAQTCAALHSRVFSRLITRHYNNKLASTGLRITQFSVMNAIKVFPPESIHQLAEILGMERTSLQRTVEKLIDKGLLKSEPTGNRRSLGLSLTPEGEKIYLEALECWEDAHKEFTSMVGEENWAKTSKQLQGFSKRVKEAL